MFIYNWENEGLSMSMFFCFIMHVYVSGEYDSALILCIS